MWKRKEAIGLGLIVVLTLIAYTPAFRAGFIWDDNDYVTENVTVRTLDGLKTMWLAPRSTPQYYPLVFTTFWIEYHLWGYSPLGYHVVNVVFHMANALLLWLVLKRLKIPGALFAAGIFALHPVHVESVAWVTERKNVLSGLFYLTSILAYIRFSRLTTPESTEPRRWGFYALALVLFVCSLFSKTAGCFLPVMLLLVTWLKRDRLSLRRDVLPVLPFFLLSMGAALTTIWLETHAVGAKGETWNLTWLQRWLLAGRILWFYAGNLVWPHPLIFVYPRWEISTGVWWQYVYPIAAMLGIVVLWLLRRRIGKGPLVGVLVFALNLFPVLGFFNVYFMQYSFVSDHWVYLASMGLISLLAAVISVQVSRRGERAVSRGIIGGIAILAVLGGLTWHQGRIYKDVETLWNETLAANPRCWMAYINRGQLYTQRGQIADAVAEFKQALAIDENNVTANNNVGMALCDQGYPKDAIPYFVRALKTNPSSHEVRNALATAFLQLGWNGEAIYHLQMVLKIRQDLPDLWYNLGEAWSRVGNFDKAIEMLGEAVTRKLDDEGIRRLLASVRSRKQQLQKHAESCEATWKANPNNANACFALGEVRVRQGRWAEAIVHYREVLKLEPKRTDAMTQLAWLLATCEDPAVRSSAQAMEWAQKAKSISSPPDVATLDALAAAYAATGQFSQAVETINQARTQALTEGNQKSAREMEYRRTLYEAGRSYHQVYAAPTIQPVWQL